MVRQGVELGLEIGEQRGDIRAAVVMRDRPADGTPQPLDAVGIRVSPRRDTSGADSIRAASDIAR